MLDRQTIIYGLSFSFKASEKTVIGWQQINATNNSNYYTMYLLLQHGRGRLTQSVFYHAVGVRLASQHEISLEGLC